MQVGELVEVHCSFTESWAQGFTVDEVGDGWYRLRRLSDGSVLPAVTGEADVRAVSPTRRGERAPVG